MLRARTTRSMRWWAVILGVGLGAFGAIALNHQDEGPQVVVAQGEQLLPSGTLTDWATYGDHLVVVTVASERRLSPSREELSAGEGYIPRILKFTVDEVLWSRDGAPAAPKTFEIELDGWVFHGKSETPLRLPGEPMIIPGHQYAMVITHLPGDSATRPGWSALAPDTIIPLQGATIGRGDVVIGTDVQKSQLAWVEFTDQEISVLAASLGKTPPDPAATGVAWKLEPAERFQVAREAHERG